MKTKAGSVTGLSGGSSVSGMLQRKCACGSSPSSLTGECAECNSKKHLQKKLTIGASNSPLEQEADRVADQVLAATANPGVSGAPPHIQRYSGSANGNVDTTPASVDRVIAGPGSALDSSLRQDMGQRFGHDFSRVRVHSGAAAEESAREVNALAYTVGHNVVFGAGGFAPGTREGRRLIAHELTHVVQQSGAERVGVGQRDENGGVPPVPQLGFHPAVQRVPAGTIQRTPAETEEASQDDEAPLNLDLLAPFGVDIPVFPWDLNPFADLESDTARDLYFTLMASWNWLGSDRSAALRLLGSILQTVEGARPLIECVNAQGNGSGPEDLAQLANEVEQGIGYLTDVPESGYGDATTASFFEGAASAIEDLDPTLQGLQDLGSVGSCGAVMFVPFTEGLVEGIKSIDPEEAERFRQRLMTNAVFNALFPSFFNAGAAIGILEDAKGVVEDVLAVAMDPAEAASAFVESMQTLAELVDELFSATGADVARELGRSVGFQLVGTVTKLNKAEGPAGFAFELGRVVGPTIVYTVLSLLGFEALLAGRLLLYAERGLEGLKKMASFARLARLLKRTPDVIPATGETATPDVIPATGETATPDVIPATGKTATPRRREHIPEPLPRRPMDFPDGIPCEEGVLMLAQLLKRRPELKNPGPSRRARHLGTAEYNFPGWSGWLEAVSGKKEGVKPSDVTPPVEGGEALSNAFTGDMLERAERELDAGKLPTKRTGPIIRDYDSEAKVLQYIADRISPQHEGTISLFIEKRPCASCGPVIDAFRKQFPKVKLNVTSIAGDC